MVIYFDKKDLVDFGKYLLSEERTKRFTENWNPEDNVPLEERLREVYHADLENFIQIRNKETLD